jgi:hypothetical protein
MHAAAEQTEAEEKLRRATYAGRPFGEAAFVERLSAKFQRQWRRAPSQATATENAAIA